jgi:hypothetical protein
MVRPLDGFVRLTKELGAMRPVLDEWTAECHRYRKVMRHDLPWWYNERASVGLIAAAAARRNWVCIEEYRTRKRDDKPAVKTKKDRHGRCDLYLTSTSGDRGFAIEAKSTWQSLSPKKGTTFPRVQRAWHETWQSVGALTADEAEVRVGALFVVPKCRLSSKLSAGDAQHDESFRKLINKVTKLHRFAGVASVWMSARERMRFDWGRDARAMYPGCVLALVVRRRGSRSR